jgi:hypothetical protein
MDVEGFVLLIAFGLSIVSFWPSARGHWLGLLLAAPSVLIGLAIGFAIIREGGRVLLPAIFVICPAYLLLGVSSILLWKWRRG